MRPLDPAPYGYRSLPPYRVTHEWRNGEILTWQVNELRSGIIAWAYEGSFGAPASRLLFDVRGVTILGRSDLGAQSTVTGEVVEQLRALGERWAHLGDELHQAYVLEALDAEFNT